MIQGGLNSCFNIEDTDLSPIVVLLNRVNKSFDDEQICNYHTNSSLFVEKNIISYYGKLIFPYAVVDKKFIIPFYNTIYSGIQLMSSYALKILQVNPINKFDTILTHQNLNYWEMYHSSMKCVDTPYIFNKIYGLITPNGGVTLDLDEVFNPEEHSDYKEKLISNEFLEQIKGYGLMYFLPLFLSSKYYNVLINPKSTFLTTDKQTNKNGSNSPINDESSDNRTEK